MITIHGKLLDVTSLPSTDMQTGVVSTVHTADILHKVRSKNELASVKLDESVLDGWSKCIGKDITAEVRFYAMKTREGGINSGLTLADKKSLPTWNSAPVEQLKKAA